MEWTDDAIVLSLRPHGEHGVILEALTRGHGRHLGLVHGGASTKRRASLQPGNGIKLHWRARLSEHLGSFTAELTSARAADMFETRASLAGLNAFTAVASAVLPERERHTPTYEGGEALLDAIATHDFNGWAPLFVRWEVGLLDELGFGLDLARCAATGATDDLTYVSPRTGRAVSAGAGEAYREKLLPLPPFLLGSQVTPTETDLQAGLALTAHFIAQWVLAPHDKALPEARERLAGLADRAIAESA
jgi:DNA repair protein RecO (recombination protein O)